MHYIKSILQLIVGLIRRYYGQTNFTKKNNSRDLVTQGDSTAGQEPDHRSSESLTGRKNS
jgi:hypothetical protein